MDNPKPLLIGGRGPYGGDDDFALYPAPEGCAGQRLCCLVFGMRRREYLDAFDRCNLVQGPWSAPRARARAGEIRATRGGVLILCGAKVSAAFGLPFRPFQAEGSCLILPHPSGRNRMWEKDYAIAQARQAILKLLPALEDRLGVVDADYAE